MRRSLKVIFCLLLVVGTLTTIRLHSAFSQEEETILAKEVSKEISGDVASVDLKNSAIVIKQLKDEKTRLYETTTIYVSNSTLIEKDYETVTIAEIKFGDKVAVEYTVDEAGKNNASNIWVELKE